jgi:hypothetical protein
MQRTKILPVILAIVPAIVFLTTQASSSEPAADACKTKPGLSAPRGSHWYYRIRADKRHCWFLSAVELHVRRGDQAHTSSPAGDASSAAVALPALPARTEDATSVAAAPPVSSAPRVQTTDDQARTPAPGEAATSAAAGPPAASAAAALPPAEQTGTIDFSRRWPENLPPVEDTNYVEPPSVSSSYADAPPATNAATQQPLHWPVVETAAMRTSSIGSIVLDYISLAGLLATAIVLLAGWAARFPPRPIQHAQRPPLPARVVRRSVPIGRSEVEPSSLRANGPVRSRAVR